MLTQKYLFIVDDPEDAYVGSMVVGDDDMTVIGFISESSMITGVCTVILFAPMEMEMMDGMTHISDEVSDVREEFGKMVDELPTR